MIHLGCTDPCATNYDPNANTDDGSCILEEEPAIECYQTVSFNTTTCEWEISGEQPEQPVVECYQLLTFNNTTCEWEITGEQPEQPITECYETATFNDTTCEWEITGEQPEIDDNCEFTDDSFDTINSMRQIVIVSRTPLQVVQTLARLTIILTQT